jgi:hypothetical protein
MVWSNSQCLQAEADEVKEVDSSGHFAFFSHETQWIPWEIF